MLKMSVLCMCFMLTGLLTAFAEEQFEIDAIKTSKGELKIVFIGHGSLELVFRKKTIYIDPFSRLADYSKFQKADLILITHEHQDHLDIKAINSLRAKKTKIIIPEICADKVKDGRIMKNGDSMKIDDIKVEAVPAYNIIHKRDTGVPFHPKGSGNGYVLTFGDKRIYIAGDTENVPEMKELKDIACAFLPMNLPYTMSPEMVFDAVRMFHPKILYPYHFGETDTSVLAELFKPDKKVELRIRKMN